MVPKGSESHAELREGRGRREGELLAQHHFRVLSLTSLHSPVCMAPGLALGTGNSAEQRSRRGADAGGCIVSSTCGGQAGQSCGLQLLDSDGVRWLSLCIGKYVFGVFC